MRDKSSALFGTCRERATGRMVRNTNCPKITLSTGISEVSAREKQPAWQTDPKGAYRWYRAAGIAVTARSKSSRRSMCWIIADRNDAAEFIPFANALVHGLVEGRELFTFRGIA